MDPVVTPGEMAAIDAEAAGPVEILIDRAGRATALAALRLLADHRGRVYGSRVAVLAGPGNNGADGRSAARVLAERGVRCVVFDVGADPSVADDRVAGSSFDLIIDACFGTGLKRPFRSQDLPLRPGETPVLAVDIPSGVDGLTGQVHGSPLAATVTVTFAAMKPGLLFEPGRTLAGEVSVVDIGLDCSRARLWHTGPSDLDRWPKRQVTAHKWHNAVGVIGGSRGMDGAVTLAATAALRAGAGYVVLGRSDHGPRPGLTVLGQPTEAVTHSLIDDRNRAATSLWRCGSVVVGPGLDLDDVSLLPVVLDLLPTIEAPLVVDAGAIRADVLDRVPLVDLPPIITPHDGEFERLVGRPPGVDRVAAARGVASDLGVIVVLKGPTAVVAHPDGRATVSTGGDQRLATAGTGDVLSGIIGAGLALGADPFTAAMLAVELHGQAARRGPAVGLVASDLPSLVAETLSINESS